jgi:tetratricopeptide (TPR) repeat protein
MPKRKTRRIDVMLSSTSKDLPDHREKATNAILRAGMTPIIMETLTASPRDAITESLRLVDEAEVYIGIFAMRYGYIPEDDSRNPNRLSITEMEYRHAVKTSKLILIFLMSDEHPGPTTVAAGATFYEQTEEGKKKLAALKDELGKKHTVGFFVSPEDLRGHILQALNDPDVRALGEVGDDSDSGSASPLPEPPAFSADPPYTLTSQFIGRSSELAQLDKWAQSGERVMLIEAIGGMGKSAVTWEWVQSRALTQHGYDGVMWWSFYESGATMSAFLRHALAYLTRGNPDALKGGDSREHLRLLQRELMKGRYLLVLDGLERVLVAYHRWNAAQMRDDTVEAAESIIKDRDIRACTDPKDDEVLKALLACTPSQFLISSRLLPLALEDRTGTLSKGVAHIHLNGLHPTDALALTRHAGVKVANERQFTDFVQTFGGHSLLVKLVAGRINKFKRARGDFERWYEAEGRTLTISDFDLKGRQTDILQYAFAGLDSAALRFLSQIAAFGDAVEYKVLAIFNPFAKPAPEIVKEPNVNSNFLMPPFPATDEAMRKYRQRIDEANAAYQAYLSAKAEYDAYLKSSTYRKALSQFDELLSDLEERGLLRWDSNKDRYDMHPVVRGTAFDRLEAEDRPQTFERIRGHFEAQQEDVEAATEVTDLTNTIGVYRTLVGAGQWDAAAEFFDHRLLIKLKDNIAAYYTVIELLTPLFADGTDHVPHLSTTLRQGSITNTLAGVFYSIGRTAEARILQRLSLKLTLDQDDSGNLIINLLNNSLKSDNQLALLERTRKAALALAEATDDANMIAHSNIYLLGLYKDTGQWTAAEAAYAALQAKPPHEIYWQAAAEHWYTESLIFRGLEAGAALDKVERLAVQGKNALTYRQIKGWRGEVALRAEDYALAQRWFEEALALHRKVGAHAGWVLGGLARAYALQGDHARTRAIADELSKSNINAAEVYHLIGDSDRAREYALKAYEWAWAGGPPYVWWWALERAKRVLDALGVSYPDLPPFDEAKIGKFPYQDEIEAYIERKRRGNAEASPPSPFQG